ncbi:hypothetical protein [Hydrogenophaga luteola]|uniref:Uncharacterized protein n=1 Tax=Hydrogenophaga luteola TaxID=1591122 RepID=A0ABV7WDC0_9BURK
MELLAVILGVSVSLAALAFLCVVGAALMVAVRTRLPGRFSVLLSVLVLPLWWVFEQLWGGSLELTFGPVAQLVSVIFYSAFAVVFSFGFVRMCRAFLAVSAVDSRDR